MNDWYKTLNKSKLTPPSWVFRTVWPILYATMAISIAIVFLSSAQHKTLGMIFFFVQLAINLSWSSTFFIYRKIKTAFFMILLIVFFLILTIFYFYKISHISAILLIPYLLLSCFSTYLSYTIIKLNK